jgi:hypothetical protein
MVLYRLTDARVVQALDLLRGFMATTLAERARVASTPHPLTESIVESRSEA